jgi:RecB family exonuclease
LSTKIPSIVKTIRNYTPQEINYAYHKTISYSQFSIYKECPHKWELQYKDGLQEYKPTIHTVFGTAMHEVLQSHLTVMFEESAAAADRVDIEEQFEETFRKVYLDEYKKNKSTHFSGATEMREFYEDGLNILSQFKKKRGQYFSKKGWHLVKVELPIVMTPNNAFKNVLFKGFIDLVLYHEPTNTFKIIDFKTSTRGWNDETKKDEGKQFQLILYKYFFSKQFNIPEDQIEVDFLILKRKIWEESEFPQSRLQEYTPPSGKIKMKKAITAINNFLEQCFNTDGSYKDTTHPITVNKNCQYCPFNDKKDLCNK